MYLLVQIIFVNAFEIAYFILRYFAEIPAPSTTSTTDNYVPTFPQRKKGKYLHMEVS